ncbi:hypothetical protein SPRG_18863 [Saprolegnia parasitica CBS 223.65]|uniref:Uncharacterized protein n=1 Tax=Saprolegnia parasitica (strain CBS 223.65) TaxID=695850 RepID=A0A067D2L2_SAPPC|nr:hypothetical protein SPRG_18863 [Saprolegnia parasitica CBS 223.65]KDO35715.1 hypothetical protein SPRG_18863 [Saprolegnia parasitica CBS 223.65]|eukprot:XP_012194079.1 hypothetical protein SPRG_18863 [Saprolegnia parasitica CBS 223.65]
MASLNGLPPIPRSKQNWARAKLPTNGQDKVAPGSARRLTSPQSASSTRRSLNVSMAHLSILRPNSSTASLVDASPRNQGDDENQTPSEGYSEAFDLLLDSSSLSQSSARDGPDVHDELQRVHAHNSALQNEVARLQESLVERMRGNSKFVGGGQFRSSIATATSPKPSSGCSNCFTLRAAIKKLKTDAKTSKPVVDDLQVKLSEGHVQRQALAAASAKKDLQLSDALTRLDSAERTIANQRAQLDQLDADLQSLREHAIAPSADATDELVGKLQQQIELTREKQKLLDTYHTQLECAHSELAAARQQTSTLETALQSTTQLLNAARSAMDTLQAQACASAAQQQQRELDTQVLQVAHDQVLQQLRNDVESWQASAAAAQANGKQLADENQVLNARVAELELDQRKRVSAMEETDREMQHLQLLRRKTSSELVGLNGRIDALLAELSAVKGERDAAISDHFTLQTRLEAELDIARRQLEQLEKALLSKSCDHTSLEVKVRALEDARDAQCSRAAEMHSELRDQLEKLGVAQNQVLKQRGQVHTLQTELKAVKVENDEFAARLDAQHQLHTKALEKARSFHAMQSLVRLCVVAPTVNVHLSGQILPCKSVLPTDAIRSIVQKDILPVFSSIFLQHDEGTSPDGSSLDAWLQSLLKEMQTSIEKHLKSVFQS